MLISRAIKPTKTMWQLINRKLGMSEKSYQDIWLQKDLEKVTHPQKVAEAFSPYFIDKVEELVQQNRNNKRDQFSQVSVKYNHSSMFLLPVHEEETVTVVSKLRGKKSAGFDEITEFLVKECIQCIKKPLSFICNETINQGSFPNLMKIAKIRPAYKNGNRQEINNYTPISILPVFSKSLEKIIYNRLLSFQFNSIKFWFINVPSQQPDGQLQKQHNIQTQITMDKE
jgi:hypothetical protein